MRFAISLSALIAVAPLFAETSPTPDGPARELQAQVTAGVAADYPALDALYRHFHSNPELSLMEEKLQRA